MKNLVLAFFLAGLVAGCGSSSQNTTDTTSETTSKAQARADGKSGERQPSLASGLSPDQVKAVVGDWQAAQNGAEFDAYATLYAAKFEGIKRIGARTYSYDRAGWLEDRERMFRDKMNVSAEDLYVSTAGPTAFARFQQTWSSGDFKDVGPKLLVIIWTPEGPRIAREEMLMSTVLYSENRAEYYNPLQAAMVVEYDYIVLDLDTESLKTKNLSLLERSGKAIADVVEPPDELAQLVGQSFVIDSRETTVESLHVLARVVPHWSQVHYWEGYWDGVSVRSRTPSDEQVAREIWELAEGPGHILVGKLSQSSYANDAWGHAPDVSVKSIPALDATPALHDRVVEAFRKLPGHADNQEGFDGEGPWSASNTNVTFWGAWNAPEYVFVWAVVGRGCGEFYGEFWAAYEFGPNGELVLLSDPDEPGQVDIPRAVVEVGGEVIFLSDEAQVRKIGTYFRRAVDVIAPYHDCEC